MFQEDFTVVAREGQHPRREQKLSTENAILTRLSPSDHLLLAPHLEPVSLKFRQQLEAANRRIRTVYFIEAGLASVIAVSSAHGRDAEVCVVGREGITGIAVVLGLERPAMDTFMQVEGHGQRISADALREALAKSRTLASTLLSYVHLFILQAGQTALANARGKIEQRLARWLLMAHDRLGGSDLLLTQEFLSIMLGVRRAGVTAAINALGARGLISSARGRITVRNREGPGRRGRRLLRSS
jgi:CRP-like cAMP-binding protein